jgi:hypothetical protein
MRKETETFITAVIVTFIIIVTIMSLITSIIIL